MKRGRRKVNVRCERMFRYPSHWSSSFVFFILLFQCEKFANLSIGQPSANKRMTGDIESVSRGTSFDDDANFHRDYIVKNAVVRYESDTGRALKSNSILKSSYRFAPRKDQGSIDRSMNHNESELNGDLLAVETNDESQMVGSTLAQHEHLRSPPYAAHERFIKANHSISIEPFVPIEFMQRHSESQLTKLHHTPASVPIYLRHPLPSTVAQHRIIAFEHPASVRKQARLASQEQDGYTINSQRADGSPTFALLPSWPKIYIAQREQPISTERNDTRPSELDPKVPTIYPNWSTRRVSNKLGQINTSPRVAQEEQLESDQAGIEDSKKSLGRGLLPPKVNLTASEVEYEETPSNRKSTARKEDSHEATSWAKLLREATKSDVMESLMLTNKSIVSLLCDADNMFLRFKFRQPFHGLVETNLDPNEQCRFLGNGSQYYEMRIDLYGCGTRQEVPRLFINNLQIQYQDPLLLIHSRLQFLQKQNIAADNRLSDVEELKTIICSYPIRPQAQTPTRVQHDPPTNDLNLTNDLLSGLSSRKPTTNLSDRIIEVPGQDSPESGRLFYYEPILMISGLLLLAIACTLALITSAYIMRRRHRKIASRSSPTIGGSSQLSSPDGLSGSPMRVYNRSPAQLANERSLLAPPLIGLSKEESLPMRPSMKRYPSVRKESSRGIQQRRESRRSMHTKEEGRTSWMHPSIKQQPGQSSTNTDTSDSLDSHTRGDESSVTTIEIPYSNQSMPQISLAPSARTSGKRKLEPDGGKQDDRRGEREVNSYTEYKQTKRHEKIIKTSYKSEPNETSKVLKTNQAMSTEPPKTESTIPFGSFRSKLTSPSEFKRLQNVKRLFEESRGDHDPTSSLSRLKMRICRTLSAPERRRLIEMLTTDEVFRSNIVDSVDRQTFSRKLKENSNYSERFSDVTWKLLEEILLQIDVDKLINEEDWPRKSEPTPVSSKEPSSKHHPPTYSYPSRDPKALTLDKQWTDRIDTHAADSRKQKIMLEADDLSDSSAEAFRVSQSNSATTKKVPHGTLFNMDSVTNISSPRNTTGYSSSFQQTTKYEETHHPADDSLPYMDELSHSLLSSESSLEIDQRHQKQKHRQ